MKKPLMGALLVLFCCLSLMGCGKTPEASYETGVPTQATDGESTKESALAENLEPTRLSLGYGMEITDIGGYTGTYMEDGSDELVSGVLMCVLTNTGDQTVQYARFTLSCGEETAVFDITTLRPGDRMVALETSRMPYQKDAQYTEPAVDMISLFDEEPSLCEDRISVQMLDGIVNVKNISAEDILSDVVIYYKNAAEDLYYGGITYRVRIEGGIPAGQIRQMTAGHMRQTGTEVVFVTFG